LSQNRISQQEFCYSWAKQQPIDIPNELETDSVIRALAVHAALLYDNPLAVRAKMRDSYRRVRCSMQEYAYLIRSRGVIGAIKLLDDMSLKFLRGFYVRDGHVFYNMDELLLLSPIFSTVSSLQHREIDMETDLEVIRYILTFHVFLSKIKLDRSDLLEPSLCDWIERQLYPRPCYADEIELSALKSIVTWLIDLEDPILQGSHGPGSVASKVTIRGKKPRWARNVVEKQFIIRNNKLLAKYGGSPVDGSLSTVERELDDDEVVMVDKGIASLRPITMVDVHRQFCQQAIKAHWYTVNDYDPDMPIRHFVSYKDQRPSQLAALTGSRINGPDSKPSTIDSKASSDYLSAELVSRLFPDNIRDLLFEVRSPVAKTDFGRVELNMYGGMGSALTFPVQSTIYTAMAVWSSIQADAERKGLHLDGGYRELLRHYLDHTGFRPEYAYIQKNIRVYGDDIAIPDFAVARLLKLLHACGLVVNEDKSFVGSSPVRESCGVYALDGYDITPLRYRLPPLKKGEDVDSALYEAIRSLANRAFVRGYKSTYKVVVKTLQGMKLFISGEIWNRGRRQGKQYPDQKQNRPAILFEEWCGDHDYIGFLSTRGSTPTHTIEIASRSLAFTAIIPKTVEVKDGYNEYYYYTQDMKQRVFREFKEACQACEGEGDVNMYVVDFSDAKQREAFFRKLSAADKRHGRIPRGMRLDKQNAYLLQAGNKHAWGWAPR